MREAWGAGVGEGDGVSSESSNVREGLDNMSLAKSGDRQLDGGGGAAYAEEMPCSPLRRRSLSSYPRSIGLETATAATSSSDHLGRSSEGGANVESGFVTDKTLSARQRASLTTRQSGSRLEQHGASLPPRELSEFDTYRPSPNFAILDAARRGLSSTYSSSSGTVAAREVRRSYGGAGDGGLSGSLRRGRGNRSYGYDDMVVDNDTLQRHGVNFDANWRESATSRLASTRRQPTSTAVTRVGSWKSESLRRKLEVPSASRRASTSSSTSSLLSRLGSRSSAVPGAVARGSFSRGKGVEAGTGVRATYESQTLSSSRRARAVQERHRAALEGNDALRRPTTSRKAFSDAGKFY